MKKQNNETYRIFICSFLNDDRIKDQVLLEINNIKERLPCKISWVKPEILHITWKFLGEITNSRIKRVTDAINLEYKCLSNIIIPLNSIEIWPDIKSPRLIVWTDKHNNNTEITKAFRSFDLCVGKVGFSKEKRIFTPHITLGRLRINEKQESKSLNHFSSIDLPYNFQINKINLIKSNLTPTGPEYETIAYWDL